MRINGIGTTWLGASKRDAEDCVTATLWFTLVWIPIVPIRRCRLQLIPHQGNGFAYRELSRTPLVARELLSSWLFCLVLVPLMVIGPFIPAIEEIRELIGMPKSWQLPWIIVCCVWMGVFAWKLADWHEQRFLPKKI